MVALSSVRDFGCFERSYLAASRFCVGFKKKLSGRILDEVTTPLLHINKCERIPGVELSIYPEACISHPCNAPHWDFFNSVLPE
jgi:hypothetical protein